MLELSQRVRESLARPLPSPPAAAKLPPRPGELGKNHVFLEGWGEISFSLGSSLDTVHVGHPKATILTLFSMLGALQLGFYSVSRHTLNIWGQCHQAGMEQD